MAVPDVTPNGPGESIRTPKRPRAKTIRVPAPVIPDRESDGASSRMLSAQLRVRMAKFAAIYNAGWMVRHSQSYSRVSRAEKIAAFRDLLLKELTRTNDAEALIFAVADALSCYPHGAPWEG